MFTRSTRSSLSVFVLVALVFAWSVPAEAKKRAKRKMTTSIASAPIGGDSSASAADDLPPLTAAPRSKKDVPASTAIVPLKPGEHPSAVQVCFDLPEGLSLATKQPAQGYVAADDGWFVLDTEITLNGRFIPERLTRAGTNCLRAWVPPMTLTSITVDFDRSLTNFKHVEATLDLKLKKDKWHDAGKLTVERAPWATISTQLPGKLTFFRIASSGRTKVTNTAQLARGRFAMEYEPPPPPAGPCLAKVTANATGTVTAARNPERLAQLVEDYERDFVPDLIRERTQECTGYERLEYRVDVRDGRFVDPWHPRVERIRVPAPVVSYALRTSAGDRAYPMGAEFDLGYGESVELIVSESQPADTLPALVNSAPVP